MLGACRLLDATAAQLGIARSGAWSRGSGVSTCTAFGCRAGGFASTSGPAVSPSRFAALVCGVFGSEASNGSLLLRRQSAGRGFRRFGERLDFRRRQCTCRYRFGGVGRTAFHP